MRIKLTDEELKSAFSEFQKFADTNGISLKDEDDWGSWWECWIDGYCFHKISMDTI